VQHQINIQTKTITGSAGDARNPEKAEVIIRVNGELLYRGPAKDSLSLLTRWGSIDAVELNAGPKAAKPASVGTGSRKPAKRKPNSKEQS